MARKDIELLAFNRGVISERGLARIDLDRMAMSAETQRNFPPRVLGSMMLRPGLEHLGNTDLNNQARQLPFTFGVDDTALIEVSAGPGDTQAIRVRVDDVLISRPAHTATISEPTFATITNWIDRDEVGGVSSNPSDPTYGVTLSLIGDGEARAKRSQDVTVNEPGVEHALDIIVVFGVATLRVGLGAWSLDDDDDLISETKLGVGQHNLAFTPGADFWIEISNVETHAALVDQINFAPTGDMDLGANPWTDVNFHAMRWEQSGDVIYFATGPDNSTGQRRDLYKIERRTVRSWSIVRYLPENGPFEIQNTSSTTLTASALSGNITLTSSKPVFNSGHSSRQALFRVASQGQTVTDSISTADVWTDPIRVVGSDGAREFGIIVEDNATGTYTVHLQFGFSDAGPWTDQGATYTAPVSTTLNDGQDGQTIYYRIGIKVGNIAGGAVVTVTLTYTGGSIQGICRIKGFTNNKSVNAEVLKDFGSIDASSDWWEGSWSDLSKQPSSVALHEGRLYWAGADKIFGSVSDGYEDWDDNTEGDSGPIQRSIGFGPIRVIHWLMSMGRLLLGTSDNSHNIAPAKIDGNNPLGARSNSFDDPLTPSNFNIKTTSSKGVFVDRTEQRLYELLWNTDQTDYQSGDLSVFAPDFNEIGIVQIAVQMKPDIRVHCVRSDGTVGMLVFDRLENVICWVDIDSSGAAGLIEDVAVLPGRVEDQVYYTIKRTINSATERHVCKWALESQATGGTDNRMSDSFKVYSGAATLTPFTTELLHLRDETVVIWADGADVGTAVVSATGGLTLAVAASDVIAGLGYTAQFKSAKLGYLDGIGLLERKKVNRLGFIAKDLHYQGLQYGPDFNNLYDLPQVQDGQAQPAGTVYSSYHEDDFAFGGEWDSDSRICLQAAAPRPCTILAAIAEMQSLEKSIPTRRRG